MMHPDHQLPPAGSARADVAVVVVLYHPGDDDLANVTRLTKWGVRVVAVVNAIDDARRAAMPATGAQVIANPSNLGLAHALNQGIGAAVADGARYVLLLDQDSRPTSDMLDALLAAATAMEAEGRSIACVAPVLHDRKSTGGANTAWDNGPFATSGTLLTRAGWEQVGPMWEPLFIDGIDHEWCFRARGRGMETVLVRAAVMEHNLGDEGMNFLGRYRPVHRSPLRHYFIVRNTLWLARKGYIPLGWRASEVAKLGYRIATYLLVSNDRSRTVGNITAALVDGVAQSRQRQPI
ncbi:glycosyltransferase [Sphingomonas panaciterrae]|uniref:glycosyltransferase n=1 Tax=Sphingomonas panaciterrae TaxID=1462999 RepID=UPI002FF20CF7